MDKFENMVRDKRQELDQAEPSEGHFERFQIKLRKINHPGKRFIPLKTFLRVAAVILVIIAISFTIEYLDLIPNPLLKGSAANELPPELKDVELYYTSLTGEKLNQIEDLASSEEEAKRLREKALTEVNELEDSNSQLQQEYVESGKNERVLDAIVNNYRIISSLLDHIINELSSEKNTGQTVNQPS